MLLTLKDDRARSVSQSDYASMIGDRRREMARICKRLAEKKIDTSEWADLFHAILARGHEKAWLLGRRLGGDRSPAGSVDEEAGTLKALLEGEHLQDFLAKLEDPSVPRASGGLYDSEGNLLLDKVQSRAFSYTGKMRATAAESFVAAGPEDELYDWVLGGTEAHCSECPLWARLSPFLKNSLPLFPGDGTTPCRGNCLCTLVRRSDGLSAFTPLTAAA